MPKRKIYPFFRRQRMQRHRQRRFVRALGGITARVSVTRRMAADNLFFAMSSPANF
jgi:hypothetical protein